VYSAYALLLLAAVASTVTTATYHVHTSTHNIEQAHVECAYVYYIYGVQIYSEF
jgi:hypothetical protein